MSKERDSQPKQASFNTGNRHHIGRSADSCTRNLVRLIENLFGGLSPAYDFVDLVQPGDYSVTAFPAQNGFYTRPVAHRRHDLAGLGPRYRTRLSAVHARRPLCLDIGSIHQTGSESFKFQDPGLRAPHHNTEWVAFHVKIFDEVPIPGTCGTAPRLRCSETSRTAASVPTPHGRDRNQFGG